MHRPPCTLRLLLLAANIVLAALACSSNDSPQQLLGQHPTTCTQMTISTPGDTVEPNSLHDMELHRFECPSGAALPNHRILWTVTSGGGAVDHDTTLTNADGLATNKWVVGSSGVQTLNAEDLDNPEIDVVYTRTNVALIGCSGAMSHTGGVSGYEIWHAGLHKFTGEFPVTGILKIEAGAEICMDGSSRMMVAEGALLQALGTEAQPVLFHGPPGLPAEIEFMKMGANPTVSGTIVHARFDNVRILGNAPVHIDSTEARGAYVTLLAPGSRFANCIIDNGLLTASPKYFGQYVLVEATVKNGGVVIEGANVTLQGCEITGNQIGVIVNLFNNTDLLSLMHITGCNIYGNSQGDVVVNPADTNGTVDGKGNWWGGGAAQVSGAIDVSNPLSSAAPIGYRPPE